MFVLSPIRFYSVVSRMQSLESALDALARLVRVLLGSDAVAASKLECGPGLSVLGVDITMCREGFQLRPSPGK